MNEKGRKGWKQKETDETTQFYGFDHFTCDCEWHNSARILCLLDCDNINYVDSNFEISTEIIGLLSEKMIENLFTMKKGM